MNAKYETNHSTGISLLSTDSPTNSCHNSHYDFNDEILPIATQVFCQIALRYLNNP
jgi:hypothetical protein